MKVKILLVKKRVKIMSLIRLLLEISILLVVIQVVIIAVSKIIDSGVKKILLGISITLFVGMLWTLWISFAFIIN